jgi:hypothetical protein
MLRSVNRNIGLKILNCAATLVMLGGCFDMLLPTVPSNLVDYLKVSRADVSPQLSLLLLGLLRALGGCLFAIGITALLIINGPLKRGEKWASDALLLLIGLSEGINASQMWRFGSPYYFPLAFVALTFVGIMILRKKAGAKSLGLIFLCITTTSAPAASPSPQSRTVLAIEGSHFTINDKPIFLLGFSYYAALGASEDFIRQDLDDFQRRGFNWLRVWATWDGFNYSISAFDISGERREPFFSKLEWLVAECDRRGLIIDITLSRQNSVKPDPAAGQLPNFEAHRRAVESLCVSLKSYRNWYLDLANERDVRDRRFVSLDELKRLRTRVREIDPKRIVTASFGGHDLTREHIRQALVEIGADFLARHRPRSPKSPSQTEAQSRWCLEAMRALGRVAPLHDQEPFRRGYTDWQPTLADFSTDVRGAITGGAAGWCFHNGSQRGTTAEEPRRSFDLRTRRLWDQLDPEERKFVDQVQTLLPKPQPQRH